MFSGLRGIVLLSIILFVALLAGITKHVIDGIKADKLSAKTGMAVLVKKYGLWIAVDLFFMVIVCALFLLLIPT